MMKRKVTVCLLAGVLVLAVSAGAAFDSINGYAALKEGVKKLALQTDNVTAEASYTVAVDGKELRGSTMNYVLDGSDWLTREKSAIGKESNESWSFCYQGNFASASGRMLQNKEYNGWKSEGTPRQNLMNVDTDEELAQRMITFAELAADTAMGDLKNTFVSLGKEDGVTRYQVDISASQVPALVNAGLSLAAYTATQDDYIMAGNVEYEEIDASFCAYFTQETGYALTQEEYQRLWYADSEPATQEEQDRLEQIGELYDRYYTENENTRKQKGGGVLVVHADNSQTYYENGQDYYAAVDSDRLIRFVGPDAALEKVHCTFGVDGEGRLTELALSTTFSSKDLKGEAHSLEVTAGFTAGEYGTTAVQPLDLTGWTNVSEYTPDTQNAAMAEVID